MKPFYHKLGAGGLFLTIDEKSNMLNQGLLKQSENRILNWIAVLSWSEGIEVEHKELTISK